LTRLFCRYARKVIPWRLCEFHGLRVASLIFLATDRLGHTLAVSPPCSKSPLFSPCSLFVICAQFSGPSSLAPRFSVWRFVLQRDGSLTDRQPPPTQAWQQHHSTTADGLLADGGRPRTLQRRSDPTVDEAARTLHDSCACSCTEFNPSTSPPSPATLSPILPASSTSTESVDDNVPEPEDGRRVLETFSDDPARLGRIKP
jgi:hypothetical protein